MVEPAVESRQLRRGADARRRLAELVAQEGPGRARLAPASSAQERHWFLEELAPDTDAYNVALGLRLSGPLDPAALERALNALCRRHESLRTVFNSAGGRVVQIVRPNVQVTLRIEDLSVEPDVEAAARTRCAAEASPPFSLTAGPLLRGRLLVLGPEDHVLALAVHHIVVDGRSLDVMLRELDVLYRREAGLAAPELPAPQAQYVDYSIWQRERLASGVHDVELAYWREWLRGAPQTIDLPLDRPRPPVREVRGRTFWRGLRGDVSERIAQLAVSGRATPFMVLLAAYAEVLARAAMQDDVLIGSPVGGRIRAEFEDAVGCFVNTVALRIDRSDGPSFRTLLARVRESVLGAFAHQEVPFDQVVQDLAPGRHLRQTPIFQVAFSYESSGTGRSMLGNVVVEGFPFSTDIVKFDLELGVIDAPGVTQLSWAFNEAVLDEESVAAWADRYERLLELAVADPDRPLASLPLLEPVERERVLAAWNATARSYPDECLHELVAAQAAATPDATAVAFGDDILLYGELMQAARRLAAQLRARGVSVGSTVGIALQRSVTLPVALLATLETGACFVQVEGRGAGVSASFVLDDREVRRLAAAPKGEARPPVSLLDPDLPAYRLDAAGGIEVSHRAICNRLRSLQERYPLRVDDRVLQSTDVGLDGWVWETFWPLAFGATVVLPRGGGGERVTTLHVTAATRPELVTAVEPAGLRRVLWSGSGVSGFAAQAGCVLHGLYGDGPAAGVAHWTWTGEDDPPTVGLPAANSALYVLDRRGEPVPIGDAGELWVGGPQLARGYAGRPRMTADRFRPDLAAETPGARMYATGEVVRRRRDGAIELVERSAAHVEPPEASAPQPASTEPRTATEDTLVRIWESVLTRQGITTGDNFFSVGGNSLRALQVIASIREQLGSTLPVAVLFTHQTVSALAGYIESMTPAATVPSRLALLQTGSGPAVVLVHPVGGSVFCYRPLVEALPETPVYAFEATEPHRCSLAELAELYLVELFEHGPELPVVLAGWSLGGVVAFEMARLLELREGFAAPVVLVDSHVGPFGPEAEPDEGDLAEGFLYELSLGLDVETPRLADRLSAEGKLAAALAEWEARGVATGIDLPGLLRRFELFRANQRALAQHRQQPYGGPVHLVEARRRPSLVETWRPLAPRISSLAVEGDHYTLLQEPRVERVGDVFRRVLEELAPARGGAAR